MSKRFEPFTGEMGFKTGFGGNIGSFKKYRRDSVCSTVASTTASFSRSEQLEKMKLRVQDQYCSDFSIKGTCKFGKRCWRKHYGERKAEKEIKPEFIMPSEGASKAATIPVRSALSTNLMMNPSAVRFVKPTDVPTVWGDIEKVQSFLI